MNDYTAVKTAIENTEVAIQAAQKSCLEYVAPKSTDMLEQIAWYLWQVYENVDHMTCDTRVYKTFQTINADKSRTHYVGVYSYTQNNKPYIELSITKTGEWSNSKLTLIISKKLDGSLQIDNIDNTRKDIPSLYILKTLWPDLKTQINADIVKKYDEIIKKQKENIARIEAESTALDGFVL